MLIMTVSNNPLNFPDLSFDLRKVNIIPKDAFKADALLIPANRFVVLENLGVKFHKPIWVTKNIPVFAASLKFGEYLKEARENTGEEKHLSFSDWLVEEGYFDTSKVANIKDDIVYLYGTSFNFFCFGTKEGFDKVLKICPMLNDEYKNILFSVVRVFESIVDKQKELLLTILEKLNQLNDISEEFVIVDVFKQIREIGKLGETLDKEAFMYFQDFVRKHENQKAQYKYNDLINTLILHALTRISAIQPTKDVSKDDEELYSKYYENIETIEYIIDGKLKPVLFCKGSIDDFHVNFFIADSAYSYRRAKLYFASALTYLSKNKNAPIDERIRIKKYNEDFLFKIRLPDKDLLIPSCSNKGVYKLNAGSNVEIKILSTK